jgi:hypothetical protein
MAGESLNMEAVTVNRWRRQRRNALIVLYLTFVSSGVLVGFAMGPLGEEAHPEFAVRAELLTACLLSLGFMWYCTVDAKLAGRPLIQLARLGIFLGWPVGVPIYLLWARGMKGLGLLLVHGFLLLLVVVLSTSISALLMYGYVP